MKFILIAASSAAVMLVAAPALAQETTFGGTSFYGNLGYTNLSPNSGGDADLSAVTGRLGARFGRYLGVEGEVSTGVGSDHRLHMNDQYAGYGVAYLPVMPNADLFARVGYGATDFRVSEPRTNFTSQDNSVNYGVGGQYFLDHANGVRLDYTRSSYDHGADGNTWGVAYVRKF